MLEQRFGRVPAKYRKAISAAETGKLEAWLDRATDAPTIAAAFAVTAH